MNKKIWVGIGLLLGGFFASVILITVVPILMPAGHIMLVVGVALLGHGIKQNKTPAIAPTANTGCTPVGNTTQAKLETSAQAKPETSAQAKPVSSAQVKPVSSVQVKPECTAQAKAEPRDTDKPTANQEPTTHHMTCSVCGIGVSADSSHVVNDEWICQACFLQKYGCTDDYDVGDAALSTDEAVASLRHRIVDKITKEPAVQFELASLLWQDAANCFPDSRVHWDGARFKLHLQTGKLSADVSTYPNQFGACCKDSYPLSADEFKRIAKQFQMSEELQAMQSEADWAKLFDDNLIAAVSCASAVLQQKEEARKSEEKQRYSCEIPKDASKRSPDMHLSKLTLEIHQMYSDRSVKVTKEKGEYHIVYIRSSNTSLDTERHPRVLSLAEAVWLEEQVKNTMDNPDESTWQSLAGGDMMNVEIEGERCKNVSLKLVKPIKKYSDLMHELEHLAQYGSAVKTG